MFATEKERQMCANLMTGAPQNEGVGNREGPGAEYQKEYEYSMNRVRRSDGGGEDGQVALLEARYRCCFSTMLLSFEFSFISKHSCSARRCHSLTRLPKLKIICANFAALNYFT